MSLKEQILKDMEISMKSRDMPRVKVLRFLKSAIKNKEIESRPEPLTDEHILGVLKKQIKQVKESLEHYKTAGYKEQVNEEGFQLTVLGILFAKNSIRKGINTNCGSSDFRDKGFFYKRYGICYESYPCKNQRLC